MRFMATSLFAAGAACAKPVQPTIRGDVGGLYDHTTTMFSPGAAARPRCAGAANRKRSAGGDGAARQGRGYLPVDLQAARSGCALENAVGPAQPTHSPVELYLDGGVAGELPRRLAGDLPERRRPVCL